MNKNLVIILAIFILPICFYYYLDKSQSVSANKINSQMPSIIKFTSPMCSECKSMEKVVNQVYPKYANKIILVEVPVQNNDKVTQDLIKEHHVTLVPTFVFKTKNGQIIKRVEGGISPKSFEMYLKGLLDD